MNQSFINIYSKLVQMSISNTSEIYSHVTNNPVNTLNTSGLWLVHGDEPLMSQWIIDALRPHWQATGQNIQRVELVSSKTWYEVMEKLDSLSLFDPANAIIVTGNHKPDKDIQQSLTVFANRVNQVIKANSPDFQSMEVQSHLVWVTPKQDKRALSAKWSQTFKSNGLIIDCNLYDEQQRQKILTIHANQFGVELTSEAWQLLMSHTQNHLLNAYQSLWRLSDLFTPDINQTSNSNNKHKFIINENDLQSALVSESNYSVYDLSDAMLAGHSNKVLAILESLKVTRESPVRVLWVIAKDMRLIQQLHSGKDPSSINIWRSKQRLYFNALNRLQPQQTQHWSKLIFDCDRAVKGLIKQPVWELLLQSALEVSGVRLFK